MRRPPILLNLFLFFALALSACAPLSAAQSLPPVSEAAAEAAAATPATKPATTPAAKAPSEENVSPSPTPEGYPLQEAPTEPAYAAPQEPGPSTTDRQPGAAPVPAGFPDTAGVTWETVVSGFIRPVDLVGDRQGRLLVVEQGGRILVVENGQKREQPYLDLSDQVSRQGNEQGLLGLALHPRYLDNGFLYVNYTDLQGDTVIARFTADPQSALARMDSRKVLLQVSQPYANHNGGGMMFGPDGFLYIGLGDGGSANDPQGYGQNLNSLLGKLLRIDVDRGDPYAIPADNPYAAGGGSPEIWASGLRNPWRFSFDALTGDIYIGDVGQNLWEEIDMIPAGSQGGINFGWNYREGANVFRGEPPAGLTLVDPIFQYQHPAGCSVTGGFVYRGKALPEFNGIYLLGDYCTGKIWGLYRDSSGAWQDTILFESGLNISSFGVDDAGELYLLTHPSGAVLKLVKK